MAKRSATTVTVACKLPQGLHIKLAGLPDLKLHGWNSPYGHSGHGMTRDVPVDQWEAVKAQHANAPWLVNGFVFATDHDSAVDQAEERQGEKAGFEPIDPKALPGNIQREGAKDPGQD